MTAPKAVRDYWSSEKRRQRAEQGCVTVSVSIPPAFHAALKVAAYESMVTVGEFVKNAIAVRMREMGIDPPSDDARPGNLPRQA